MTFECADAYFQYGSALLEQARMEDNLLSNAIKGSEHVLGEDSDEGLIKLLCSSRWLYNTLSFFYAMRFMYFSILMFG